MVETKPTILLSIPAEIWKCEVMVNKANPLPEAEALVLESLYAAGNVSLWAKKMGASPPYRTLSSLISRNFIQINAKGDAEISDEIIEAMESGGLVELLNMRQGQKFAFWVVRELLTGSFHHRRILYETTELKPGWMGIECERKVEMREHEDLDVLNVNDIVQPVRATIAWEYNMRPHLVSAACRMVHVESQETDIKIPFRWHKRQDGTTVPLPMNHHELGSFIVENRLVAELQPHRVESETKRMWPASPELEAITKIDTLKKMVRRVEKGHVKAGRPLLNSLLSDAIETTESTINEIEKNELPRINSVRSIVGTEFEQWNAIQAVINSSKSKCVLLTAFTHPDFADEAAGRINDSLPEGCELLLLSGEPDRIHETGFAERTKEYEKSLRKHDVPSTVRIENTRRASHAKFAISDTGMIWIGSCNMLSAAPGSWITETGLLIDDSSVCKSIITHILDDKWLNPSDEKFLLEINESIPNIVEFVPRGSQINALRKILKNLKETKDYNDREYSRNILKHSTSLMRELTNIAERPCWSLIETDQHRPLFLSMVRESRKRILIGTDAIRAGGLDKSTIDEISRRPAEVMHRASKFVVQICWGRQDPDFKKKNEDIVEAGKRLKILREKVENFDKSGEGLRSIFFPKDNKPMMNHGKFLAIDEQRLLITSDNLLSFADDEGWDSDARELGILIDSPRTARRHRAEIELLNDFQYGDQYDRARWHGALAGCLDELGGDATFHELMEALTERIQSSKQLMKDWFWSVNFICNQYNIDVQTAPYAILTEGEKDGFYKLKWVGDMKTSKRVWIPNIRSDDERLENLRLVNYQYHGITRVWSQKGMTNTPLGSHLRKGEKFAENFSKALLEKLESPDEWEDFGTVFARVINDNPEFKIKKAGKFLSQCEEWIEVSYTDNIPPTPRIRRRQV